ncbi:MAG TPA: hypothetical protein VF559_09465 [Caulobacteraceae bacterium]|jgi:hypothetical protein
MSHFPVTEAALSGFTLLRRRPREVLIWAGVRLVMNFAMGALVLVLGAQRLSQLQAISDTEADVSLTQIGQALLSAWPLIAVLVPLSLVVQTVLYAAIYRAWLRPEQDAGAYLRLGRDEFRLIGVTLLWMLLFAGVLFAVTFIAGVIAALADEALRPFAAVTGLVLFLGVLFVLLWAMVRLSLAWTATFAHRRIEVLRSWRLTRGRFWPLSGAYFVAFAVALVAALAVLAAFAILAVTVAVASGAGMAAAGQAFNPNATSLAAYFTVAMLGYLAMEALISTLTTVLLLTPTAEALRVLDAEAKPAASSA